MTKQQAAVIAAAERTVGPVLDSASSELFVAVRELRRADGRFVPAPLVWAGAILDRDPGDEA